MPLVLGLLIAPMPAPAAGDSSPAVRQADPTTPAALEKLGLKRFNGFLELHVSGTYSPEARQQRFNALFLLAHKTFILNDREHYVLHHLKTGRK